MNTPIKPFRLLLRALLVGGAVLLLIDPTLHAGSATWNLSPTSGDWNTAANWTPATIPNGSSDVATFAVSNTTGVALSATTQVNGIVFSPGASAYTINVITGISSLTIGGIGVVNDSAMTQNFLIDTGGAIFFQNSATAESGVVFTTIGAHNNRGEGDIFFSDFSSAGNATFISEPGTFNQSTTGSIQFHDSSTAGNGTFICNGASVPGAGPGYIEFDDATTAGTGTFTCNGGTAALAYGG